MASRIAAKLDAAKLKDYAARLLAGRALTSAELRRKLRSKAARLEDADEVLEALRGYGMVDDRRLASSFATNRAESGLMGRTKAFAQLRGKGVASTIAQNAVAQAYDGRDEVKMVEEYLARKYRSKNLGALLQDKAKLASVYRRLRAAGFGSAAAIGALKRHARDAEMLEDMPEETGE